MHAEQELINLLREELNNLRRELRLTREGNPQFMDIRGEMDILREENATLKLEIERLEMHEFSQFTLNK